MKSKAATAPITFEEVVMVMIKIKKCRIIHGRERRVTCQQLIVDIRHVENTILFHVCFSGFSQCWKSLINTVVYMISISFVIGLAHHGVFVAQWCSIGAWNLKV